MPALYIQDEWLQGALHVANACSNDSVATSASVDTTKEIQVDVKNFAAQKVACEADGPMINRACL